MGLLRRLPPDLRASVPRIAHTGNPARPAAALMTLDIFEGRWADYANPRAVHPHGQATAPGWDYLHVAEVRYFVLANEMVQDRSRTPYLW